MKHYIHVNQSVIRHNAKYGNTLPACRVQESESGKSRYCREVIINGPSKMIYNPENPLACGARLWIETDAPVELVGEVAYSEIATAMREIVAQKRSRIG